MEPQGHIPAQRLRVHFQLFCEVKMEPPQSSIRAILALSLLLLLLLSGPSSANRCFDECCHSCRIKHSPRWFCKFSCWVCLIPKFPPKVDLNLYLACTKSSCSHLDQDGKEMKACLESCLKNRMSTTN